MEDEADQPEQGVEGPPTRRRPEADPLTITLVAFFVALILIVAALLVLPMLGSS